MAEREQSQVPQQMLKELLEYCFYTGTTLLLLFFTWVMVYQLGFHKTIPEWWNPMMALPAVIGIVFLSASALLCSYRLFVLAENWRTVDHPDLDNF